MIDQSPKIVESFQNASIKGWEYAINHPVEIIQLILKKYNPNLSEDHLLFEADTLTKLIEPTLVEVGHMNPHRWERIAQLYADLELIPQSYSLEGFIFDSEDQKELWSQRTLIIVIVFFGLLAAGIAALSFFNQTLRRKVKQKTEEWEYANKCLQAANEDLELRVRERTYELEKQNELILLSIEAAGLGTWEWDIDGGGQIYWDENIHRIFGYELGQFPGTFEGFSICIYDEDKEETLAAIQHAYDHLDHFETSYRIVRRDNQAIRWVSIKAKYIRNEQGETIRMRGVIWDSTEDVEIMSQLREQKEKLEISEEFHRNIIEHLPFGMHMYELDENGDLIFIDSNQTADDILGIKNRQLLGKTMTDAFPNIVNTEVPKRFNEIAQNGGYWEKEEINYEDGQFAGIFSNYNFQTAPNQVISLFKNITEVKKNEAELKLSESRFPCLGGVCSFDD